MHTTPGALVGSATWYSGVRTRDIIIVAVRAACFATLACAFAAAKFPARALVHSCTCAHVHLCLSSFSLLAHTTQQQHHHVPCACKHQTRHAYPLC